MILRNGIKRAGPAVCLFLTLLLASIPSLGETETESTESQGLLPLPDYSGDLRSRGISFQWNIRGPRSCLCWTHGKWKS